MIVCGCGSEMKFIDVVYIRLKGQPEFECYKGKLYACTNEDCNNFVVVVDEIVNECDDIYIDYNVDKISVVRFDID